MRSGAFVERNVSRIASQQLSQTNSKNHPEGEEQDEERPITMEFDNEPVIVDESSALFHETLRGQNALYPSVHIKQLKKKFGNVAAVNGISLSLYENQILW